MTWLYLVSVLTANPIHTIRELDSVPTTQSQTVHGPRFQFARCNTNGKLWRSSDEPCKLHRRAHDLEIGRDVPYMLVLPIDHAASTFWERYCAILPRVNMQWSLQALLPSLWIRKGELELLLRSVSGPIPWSVVAGFAHKMLCEKQLGWIGTYNNIDQNTTTDQAVGVTPRDANNQLSLPQPLTDSRTVSEAKDTLLKKRGQVRLVAFKIYDAIVPLSLAAPYMKAFFDAIAIEAAGAWRSQPQAALLTVTQGPFQLTASCLGARIPWSALALAAQKFSAQTDAFFVNTFDAFYEESGSAITLAFSLRLLQVPVQQAQGPLTLSVPSKRTRRTLHAQTPPTPSTATRHSLHPRSPSSRLSPQIRVTKFLHTLVAMAPTAVAAAHLEDFYTLIALKIETGQLAHTAPGKKVVCSLWDFELTFSCENMVVPLSFVQAFAIDMAAWSARHFTGFYDAQVIGEGALEGLVISVQMRLKGMGMGLGE